MTDGGKEVQVWGTFRGNEWSNKGEAANVQEVEGKKVGIWGFDVKVQGAKDYFIVRTGCEYSCWKEEYIC